MPDSVALEAPAKINLYLEVVGRRPDGYHEIVTVLQTLALADHVELRRRARDARLPADTPDVRLQLRLPEGSRPVPADASNLAVSAAAAWLTAAGRTGAVGLDLLLDKRIPAGAGLGGGSSDAATVLLGLQQLLAPGLDAARLHAVAAALGSDVPFFLTGGTALATGRGERVVPLPAPAALELELLVPDFGLPTPEVYRRLGASDLSSSARAQVAPEHWAARLDRADVAQLEALYRNDLEAPAAALRPELAPLLAQPRVHLSGSGSTLFIFGGADVALTRACERLCIRRLSTRSKNR